MILWYTVLLMAEEKQESIWKFYFQARWQTALNVHYLVLVSYLVLFYIGNVWNAIQFAFYTFISSPEMLGLEFALWGIIFEITVMVPFFASWYAIFLLPKIWRSHFSNFQKTFLTLLMLAVIPAIIIVADTTSRYALETEHLREFVAFYDIVK